MHTLPRPPAFLLLLLLAAVPGGCHTDGDPAAPVGRAAVPVRTAEVVREHRAEPARAIGLLQARDEVRLSFKIPGVVGRVTAGEGDRVAAGQVLATLDPAEITAQVTQAQQSTEKSLRDLRRVEALYRDSVVTLEQLQDAQTGYEVSRSALQIAQFNQQHAVITAPVGGVVLERRVEGGEMVSPGAPAFVLGSTSRGWVVRAGLPDRDALRINAGDRAVITFDAFPDRRIPGRVTSVSVTAAPRTGTYEAEIALEAGGFPLAAGLVAHVELFPSQASEVTLVPIEALVEGSGRSGSVFTVSADGSTAVRVPVQIAFITGEHLAVRAGLDSVRTVITDGVPYLREGTLLRVVQ